MHKVTCFIAIVREELDVPERALQRLVDELPRFFADGSNSDISIRTELWEMDDPWIPETTRYQLNKALRVMVGRQRPKPGEGVKNIGLLLADRVERDSIFGIMFDDGVNEGYSRVQREGAAVFVDSIRASCDEGGLGEDEFVNQLVHVAAHEIGHVFNLWHARGNHFLTPPELGNPLPAGSFKFAPEHQRFLAQCSTQRYVQPGGSPWQDWGDLRIAESGTDVDASAAAALRLRIDVSPSEMWAGEPVELEVVVRSRAMRSWVPDTLDPGYECCRIWIEDPDGQRHLFAPRRVYCASPRRLWLNRAGIRRDISLLAPFGSQTFRKAGTHRITMTWRLSGQRLLRSNTATLHVRQARHNDAQLERSRRMLGQRVVRDLLYYRAGAPRSRVVLAAVETAEGTRRWTMADRLLYAWGRAVYDEARQGGSRRARLVKRATAALDRAAQSPLLGVNERETASRYLEAGT